MRMELILEIAWEEAWLEHATCYKQKSLEILHNKILVSRLQEYSSWKRGDKELAKEAWHDLLTTAEHTEAPRMSVSMIEGSEVPAPMHEASPISTNDAALWSLDAIYMQEVIPQD